ncbi:MAG: hypothetical protein F4X39_04595 [Acidobacteriia bacterium]|nr:hypothetical protein [Terriglobia bacterium]
MDSQRTTTMLARRVFLTGLAGNVALAATGYSGFGGGDAVPRGRPNILLVIGKANFQVIRESIARKLHHWM